MILVIASWRFTVVVQVNASDAAIQRICLLGSATHTRVRARQSGSSRWAAMETVLTAVPAFVQGMFADSLQHIAAGRPKFSVTVLLAGSRGQAMPRALNASSLRGSSKVRFLPVL